MNATYYEFPARLLLILGVFGLFALSLEIGNVFSSIVRELGTPVP